MALVGNSGCCLVLQIKETGQVMTDKHPDSVLLKSVCDRIARVIPRGISLSGSSVGGSCIHMRGVKELQHTVLRSAAVSASAVPGGFVVVTTGAPSHLSWFAWPCRLTTDYMMMQTCDNAT